jgi:hypothetical protein
MSYPAWPRCLQPRHCPSLFGQHWEGKSAKATQAAILDAEIEGCKLSTHAVVLDDIGKDEDGKPIDIFFGALAMQQWGIRPVPDQEKLDLSHYSKEFLEF